MITELILKNSEGLLPKGVQYSNAANAFLSDGVTSLANNTYFNAFRFAEGIVIKEDIGQGYLHSFLNGIRIYSLKDKVLLIERSYYCCFYSKETVENEAKKMLTQLLLDAAEREGLSINKTEVEAAISKHLSMAFNSNQLEMAQQGSRVMLKSSQNS